MPLEPVDISYDKSLSLALKNRQEIRNSDIKIRQSREEVKLAKSGFWPYVTVGLEYKTASDVYYLDRSDYHDLAEWQVVTKANWDIFHRGSTKDRVNQKKADLLISMAQKKKMIDQIEVEVRNIYNTIEDSQKKINVSRMQIESAERHYQITYDRYRERMTTNTELLDAQTLLTQAKNNNIIATTDFCIAKAALLKAMGKY